MADQEEHCNTLYMNPIASSIRIKTDDKPKTWRPTNWNLQILYISLFQEPKCMV